MTPDIIDDHGADLKKVDTPSMFLVLLHIVVWILWAFITGLVALVGYPIVYIEARRLGKEGPPSERDENGTITKYIEVPFKFRKWAKWWDSPVSTWPESWWWGHQEQIERKLHRQHFKSIEEYYRANLYHWRAVRNPRNYFSRAVPREDHRLDVVQTRSSWSKPMYYVPEHHGDRYAVLDYSYQRYRWDKSRPWLGYWHRVQIVGSKYIEMRFGFKLAHAFVGMGFTTRLKLKDRKP